MSILERRSDQLAADRALIEGVQQFLADYPSVHVGSRRMTPDQIVQILQERVEANLAADAAAAAHAAAVKANRDKRAATARFEQSLRKVVHGMFSESPDVLAVFALRPPKVPTLTAEAKKEAVAKNKATRLARHTLGPKARLAIHGEVPGTSVVADEDASLTLASPS